MSLLVTGASPLLATGATHSACPAHHQDCSKDARLKGCCGIEQSDRSDPATPAGGSTQFAQPVADGTMAVTRIIPALPVLRRTGDLTASACPFPPDLIKLFGTFLI